MTDDICGSTDTDSGEPCGLPPGWGTDRDQGHCRKHSDDGENSGAASERAHKEATKYNEIAERRICEALRKGATYRIAARAAGIHPNTLRRWRNRFPEFNDKVKRAEAEAATGWLDKIDGAIEEGDWRAAAWKLEKRFPEMFGDADAEDEGGELDLSNLTDEQLDQFIELTEDLVDDAS